MAQLPEDWITSAVFYQIFPDRFAKSDHSKSFVNIESWESPPTLHGFKGGDLWGVIERLDYLQDLGINALYFNPIFASTANHRYHTHDYLQVDPVLGGNVAFRALLQECRRRQLRVVLDGVFNHASRGFYQFSHTLENGRNSPYTNWFHFNEQWLVENRSIAAYGEIHGTIASNHASSFERFGYQAWWDIPALPKFNTATPEVREYLWAVAAHWIREGIDGWRLDVANEIDDDEFWQEFRRRVKGVNPDTYIVGEVWDDARRWLKGDQFDGVTNYPLGQVLLGFCLKDFLNWGEMSRSGLKATKTLAAQECAHELWLLFSKYPKHAVYHQLNFVTSHDTPRLLTIASGDLDGVKLVLTGLMTLPGSPCIYYGEEIGMSGGHDPDCRRGFDWDPNLWNHSILDHLKALIKLRRQSRALQIGEFRTIYADQGVLLFDRLSSEHQTVVALNTNTTPVSFSLHESQILSPDSSESMQVIQALQAKNFVSNIGPKDGMSAPSNGSLHFSLSPRMSYVWSR